MKIPLTYVKLRDSLDSVEPLNTTGLSATRGWTLVLDTATGFIRGTLTRGDGDGRSVKVVEFDCAAAAHWVRENWEEDYGAGVMELEAYEALYDELHPPVDPAKPKPKPTGGKRGRKGPRARSSEANRIQPEGAGGDKP